AWDIQNRVWPVSRGAGVTVAVLDTGVNAALPDLAGQVLPGGDATGGGTDGRTDTDPDGHGTSMAAFIAAQGRGTDMLGVAPEARILPVVTQNDRTDPPKTYANAIRFAVDHGARVLNMSIGANGSIFPGHCPAQVQDAVRYAVEHGAVVVAAAGNERQQGNPPDYPAACVGVLAVGAIDNTLAAWSDTEQQSYVDVAGPGVGTVTINGKGQVVVGAGTSDATALVSGAVALVWSKFPKLTNRQVVARILASVRDAGPPGRDDLTGTGVVRPSHALLDNIPADAPNPVFDELESVSPSGPAGSPPASGEPSSAPTHSPSNAAGTSSDSDSESGSIFPVVFYVVIGLAALTFVVSTVLRRRHRRPAFGTPVGWSGPPPPNQQQWTPPPGQQYPPPGQQYPPAGQPPQPPQPPQWPAPPNQPGYPPAPPEH
ncbi:MAG TPA: S8 family serine peptidase, partial [Mycobacteriales bacterium]